MQVAREMLMLLEKTKLELLDENSDDENKYIVKFYEDFFDFIMSCAKYYNHEEILNVNGKGNRILAFFYKPHLIMLESYYRKNPELSEEEKNKDSIELQALGWRYYMSRNIKDDGIYIIDVYKLLDEERKIKFINNLNNLLEPLFSNEEIKEILDLYKSNMKQEPETTLFQNNVNIWLDSQFESIIGLQNIKNDIYELLNFIIVNQKREEAGLKKNNITMHMVFSGNPGTGKTTIARMIGSLYKRLGLINEDEVIEVSRADLVAEYLGQTAIKTQNILDKANGKVLFIDEAYTLSEGKDSYGKEAIDTILKFMEDNRSNMVIIVAGYENQMNEFLSSNPGLSSRFNKKFIFNNYTTEELLKILLNMCNQNNYKINENDLEKIHNKLEKIEKNVENFSNARYIRNLYEKAIVNQATRISKSQSNEINLEELTYEDFEEMFNN